MSHGPVPFTHTRRKEALPTAREGLGAAAMTQWRDGRPAPGARPGSRRAEAAALFPLSLPFPPTIPGGRSHHVTGGARDTARRHAPPPSRAHGGGGGGRRKAEEGGAL